MNYTRKILPVNPDPPACDLSFQFTVSEREMLIGLLKKAVAGQRGLSWTSPTPTEQTFLRNLLMAVQGAS